MHRKIILLTVVAFCVACVRSLPELEPPGEPCFRSLSVKFQFREQGRRQSGRVHWRFDEDAAKFLFFTPLNQVGLELDVDGEEAVLVNFSKKSFWRGDFSLLLDRLWGIGLPLAELKSLLVAGEVPQAGFTEKSIAASVERDPGSGQPRAVRLQRGSAELELRVLRSQWRPGRIILIDYAGRYRAADLEAVLEE